MKVNSWVEMEFFTLLLTTKPVVLHPGFALDSLVVNLKITMPGPDPYLMNQTPEVVPKYN